MKKITMYVLVLTLSVTATAQKQITVVEGTNPMSWGNQPSFQTIIPQTTLKEVEKEWIKYTSTKSKEKTKKVNEEYVQLTAVNPNVSPTTFTVYGKLFETQEGVRLTAWATGSDSVFISASSTPDRAAAFSKYVRDFAVQAYRDAVSNELEAEKLKLKNLEKELKSVINKEEKSRKKINQSERSIDKNKNAIATNKNDQERKNVQVQTQKKAVEDSRTAYGSASEEMEKTLKTFEKEKKKLEKENEKLHSQIDKYEKTIRDNVRSIEDSKSKQRGERDNIEKQKAVVKAVEGKLNGIQ